MANHDDTMAAIAENEKRIEVHEAVCAERYKGILDSLGKGDKRMQRIEYIIYLLAIAVIGGRDVAMRIVEFFAK